MQKDEEKETERKCYFTRNMSRKSYSEQAVVLTPMKGRKRVSLNAHFIHPRKKILIEVDKKDLEETLIEDAEDVADENYDPKKKLLWKRRKLRISKKIKKQVSSSKVLQYAKRMGFRVETKCNEDSEISLNDDELEIEDKAEIVAKPKIESNPKMLTRKTLIRTINTNEFDKQVNWSNGLPYEILLKIFTHFMDLARGDLKEMKSIRYVCKYWSVVSNDAQLWQMVNLSEIMPKHTEKNHAKYNEAKFNQKIDKFLGVAIKQNKFRFLVKLSVYDLPYLTCDQMSLILSNCNQRFFSELTLANCRKVNASTQSLQLEKVIADYCPNLRCLDLSRNEKVFSHTSFSYLFEKLGVKLKDLNLSNNQINSTVMDSLSEFCFNLEILDISYCQIRNIVNFDQMGQKFRKLKYLNLLKCDLKTRYNTIETVLTSPEGFISLEKLSIDNNPDSFHLDPMTFVAAKMFKDSVKLRSLDIRYFKSPIDHPFNLFDFIKSDKLERIYLCNSNLNEKNNEYFSHAVSKWTSSLKELDLSWSNISRDALEKIFTSLVTNPKNNLRLLHLSGTCVDIELINLIATLKNLEIVDVTSCRSMQRGLKKILTKKDLKNLSSS